MPTRDELDQSAHDRAIFRIEAPDVVAFCEGTPLEAWGALLDFDGTLTRDQILSARMAILNEAIEDENAPAEEWHASWIPNGDYSVTFGGCTFEFRIHLVRSGVLRGKRIVKVKRPGTSVYTGFGFVTRSGRFQLWRRFANEEREPHVTAVRALLLDITENRHDTYGASWILGAMRMGQQSFSVQGIVSIDYLVRNVRCFHCNNIVTTTAAQPMFALCADHSIVPPAPVHPDQEFRNIIESEIEADRANFGTQTPRRRASRTPRAPAQSAQGPRMSQVTGKYVQ
jgi:hypothetical protein